MIMQIIFQKCDPVNSSGVDEVNYFKGLGVIPEVETIPENYDGLLLKLDGQGLSLSRVGDNSAPTRVDFQDARLQYRVDTSRRHEGLLKAVGLDKRSPSPVRVLDATAGLATDAYLLAAFGCDVTLAEKSPVMAALIQDGLNQGLVCSDGVVRERLARMQFLHTDAHTLLRELEAGDEQWLPDVIYLDPMFPARQKTAKVKKDMALLQALLEPNLDVAELLAIARRVARKRVVLKRPGKSEKHPSPRPDFQVPGKSCHFQVFLKGQ